MDDNADGPRRSLVRPFVIGVVTVAALLVLVGSWFGVRNKRFLDESLSLSRQLLQMNRLSDDLRAVVDEHLLLVSRSLNEVGAADAESLQQLSFEASRRLNRYLHLTESVEERKAVEAIRALHADLALHIEYVIEMQRRGRRAEALAGLSQVVAIETQLDSHFAELYEVSHRRLRAALGSYRAAETQVRTVVIALMLMAAFCLLFLWLLRERVLRPLDSMVRVARAVADGDYGSRLDVQSDDELGWLSHQFNEMTRRLGTEHRRLQDAVDERTRALQEVQRKLVQSEKMSVVGRLVSGVAHELNNPLTAIMGLTELTRDTLREERPDVAAQLDDVMAQAERCRLIVTDLLQVARQRETRLEPVELGQVVASGLDLFRGSMRTAEVVLEVVPADAPCFVLGDPFKLQQVLLSLLNNAVDAMRQCEPPRRIRVVQRRAGEHALLEVEDSGPGIAEPARVFEPFYTTKEVGNGTGLGLSICYGIVEEHGGEIHAENLPLRGAAFRVSFPLTRRRPVEKETGTAPVTIDAAGHALLVDDEEPIRQVGRVFLERLGFACATARDGEEAIAVLQRQSIDLVISDLRMPGPVNGVQLFDWVRRNHPAAAERFLFVTGDLVRVGESSEEPLPRPCILKPFGFSAFARAVAKVWDEPLACHETIHR